MSNHLMQGFKQLAGLLIAWLKEAHDQGHLKENLNFNENRRIFLLNNIPTGLDKIIFLLQLYSFPVVKLQSNMICPMTMR